MIENIGGTAPQIMEQVKLGKAAFARQVQ
jgi:hypothetical protein